MKNRIFLKAEAVRQSFDLIANKGFTDGSGTLRAANIALTSAAIVIDNAHYGYSVQVGAAPTGAFYNARLVYTYDKAGD